MLAFIMEPVGGLATGALVTLDAYYALMREVYTCHVMMLISDEVIQQRGLTIHQLR